MVSHPRYGKTKWMVTMYSMYTAHISSNESKFLTAWFLVYWIYTVLSSTFCWPISGSTDHKRSVKLVTVCFHMLYSLPNVIAHHLWVQFLKSTLFLNEIISDNVLCRTTPATTGLFKLHKNRQRYLVHTDLNTLKLKAWTCSVIRPKIWCENLRNFSVQ